MKADHTAFEVASLDTAIAFYTKKLGLNLLFRERDEEHGEAFAFLELEGCNVELLQRLDGEPMAPRQLRPPYCPHLAIATNDLDGMVAGLKTQGISPLKGPLEIPDKVRWVYYADPDGNVLEFVQWA